MASSPARSSPMLACSVRAACVLRACCVLPVVCWPVESDSSLSVLSKHTHLHPLVRCRPVLSCPVLSSHRLHRGGRGVACSLVCLALCSSKFPEVPITASSFSRRGSIIVDFTPGFFSFFKPFLS
ncbi:hypothetical protein B0H63DRAFT_266587 [Podospora didyma]|uniref:Secreted protein n=1 Tax=Podospora didyma TaxID=330526 RepID=A0AAE0N8U6_9PEZI|nr:hypothetical protein B0H63DRAFT_266587 [Podospora didyma]